MNNNNEIIPNTDSGFHNVNIKHINIQSIRNEPKRIAIENLLKEKLNSPNQIDFLMLSETHVSSRKDLHQWINHHPILKKHYKITTDHSQDDEQSFTRSKGTTIIYTKTYFRHLQDTFTYPGRFTALLFKRNEERILIGCVYLPTKNQTNLPEFNQLTAFINTTLNQIRQLDPNTKIILGGDWNAANNLALDRYPQNTRPAIGEHNFIKQLTNLHNPQHLVDIWRLTHPTTEQYSHTVIRQNENPIKSRIDYFLISHNIITNVTNTSIEPQLIEEQSQMHHDWINLTIRLTGTKPSIITDSNFNKNRVNIDYRDPRLNHAQIKAMNEEIDNAIRAIAENIEQIPDEQDKLNEYNKHLNQILNKNIRKYIPTKSKERTTLRTIRRQKYNNTWKKLMQIKTSPNPTEDESNFVKTTYDNRIPFPDQADKTLNQLINEILTIMREEMQIKKQQQIERHKTERLESFIVNQKRHITNLFESKITWDGLQYIIEPNTGRVIDNPNEVKNKTRAFYKTIFCSDNNQHVNITNLWENALNPLPDVQDEWFQNIHNPVTLEELKTLIKSLPNNKSPGPSGIAYDHIKLAVESNITNMIVEMINLTLTTHLIPEDTKLANIILLPKISNWMGQLDKTRPITLLETYRKLVTAIITRRLTNIIDKHDILKGSNFGFRTGKSTTDALLLIRGCIDDAKEQKRPLLAGNLDIKKAFDTVPSEALKRSLRRIHVPNQTIELIISLVDNRLITISTPHGDTDTFIPTRGIPQGDPISPILWAIFYDPLLVKLQKDTIGYQINEQTRITASAYADDITPLSETPEDLQDQLDIIHSYLDMFHMTLSAEKSSIISNRTKNHPDFPDYQFHLGPQPIPNTIPGDELVRYLGVYWSLNGNTTKTRQRVKNNLQRTLAILNPKYIPGRQSAYLVNTCIIPQLQYALQLIPMDQSTLNTLNTSLRAFVKRKCRINQKIPNNFLYDPDFNINLADIEQKLEQKILNDIATWTLTDNTQRCIIYSLAEKSAHKLKRPDNILKRPPGTTTKRKKRWHLRNMINYVSSILHKYNLNIESTLPDQEQLTNLITNSELYDTASPFIAKFKLNNWRDTLTNHNGTKLLSFQGWAAQQSKYHRNKLIEHDYTPDWYKIIQQTLTQESSDDITKYLTIQPKPTQDHWYTHAINNRLGHGEYEIWTDGSKLENNNMGAAAVFTNQNQHEPQPCYTTKARISQTNTSSTKGELYAINIGLTHIASHSTYIIKSDSQSALSSIRNTLHETNNRRIIKRNNHSSLIAIREEIDRIQTTPTMHKIPSHTGKPEFQHNDTADLLAKEAANHPQIQMTKAHIQNHNIHLVNHDSKPLDIYPSNHLKKLYIKSKRETTETRLRNHYPDISIPHSHTIAHRLIKRKNRLDESQSHHQMFRTQILHQTLTTMDKLLERGKRTNSICPRCDIATEDFDHIWTCQDTKEQLHDIINELVTQMKNDGATDRVINKTLHHMQLNDPIAFLSTYLAKGIMDTDTLNRIPPANVNNPTSIRKRKTQINNVMRATHNWMTLFHDNIWKPRCQLVALQEDIAPHHNPPPHPSPQQASPDTLLSTRSPQSQLTPTRAPRSPTPTIAPPVNTQTRPPRPTPQQMKRKRTPSPSPPFKELNRRSRIWPKRRRNQTTPSPIAPSSTISKRKLSITSNEPTPIKRRLTFEHTNSTSGNTFTLRPKKKPPDKPDQVRHPSN